MLTSLRRRFFVWLFHRVERHRHGDSATWWDRRQCDGCLWVRARRVTDRIETHV